MKRSVAPLRLSVGAACLAVCAFVYVHKPPSPDQGIFDYIGWVGSEGGRYYVDVAEQNFPGELILHELAIRVFGVHTWAHRALDLSILLSAAVALTYVLRCSNAEGARVFAVGLFVAGYVSSNPWMSGQRDVIAANFLLIGSALVLRREKSGGRGWLVGAAIALFAAALLRPTYLLFILGMMIVFLASSRNARPLRQRMLDATVLAGLMCGIAGGFLAYAKLVGSLDDFLDQAVLFNLQAYSGGTSVAATLTRLQAAAVHYLWFAPSAVFGGLFVWRSATNRIAPAVLVGMFPLAGVSAILQRKGYAYHLGAVLVPMFALAGVGVWLFLLQVRSGGARVWGRTFALGLATLLVVVGAISQARTVGPQLRYLIGTNTIEEMMAREPADGLTWAELRQAARYAAAATTDSETILVWGRAASIHLLAQRRSPSRFITHGMLLLANPPFEPGIAWEMEFREDLARHQPRLVFIQALDGIEDYGDRFLQRTNPRIVDAVRSMVRTSYQLERKFGAWNVYRRLEGR